MNVPIFAIAGRNPWRKFTPLVLRETVLFPVLGFLGLIGIWWVIAIFRSELMPTPLEALNNNLHYILNPFSQKGPGELGIGWLLLARACHQLGGLTLVANNA